MLVGEHPSESRVPVQRPWAREWQEIAEQLGVDTARGLDAPEVVRRRREYGPNRLRESETRSAWEILVEQFRSLVVVLLVIASGVAVASGELTEGIAIGAVIAINAAIGFVTELRAVRSMEALQELTVVPATVRRHGEPRQVCAEEIVPGDLVLLEGGDVVTADLRLIEANKLQADESALTGESVPVSKQTQPVDAGAPLAERQSMLFKGTAITRGSGEGLAVTTGLQTALGTISSLVAEAEEEATPLENRLNRLGRRLVWITLGLGLTVLVSGLLTGRDVFLIIETAIALGVAAVPEGLPIVATIALARGLWRMAQRHALINRLSAVETLGTTNVICTDKTGTLTENRMTVVQVLLPTGTVDVTGEGLEQQGNLTRDGRTVSPAQDAALARLLRVGVLCNNAGIPEPGAGDGQAVGEPLEIALLVLGAKAGLRHDDLERRKPEEREEAFDPDVKMMATFHRQGDGRYLVAVKGAPSPVVRASARIVMAADGEEEFGDAQRQEWLARNEKLAQEGLRVIALAGKTVDDVRAEPYENLTFLGLAALLDPPREGVRPSLESCREAGINVVMVTGDHPATALRIAQAVGLVDRDAEQVGVLLGEAIGAPVEMSDEERRRMLGARILARVSPEQKLDLIAAHQQNGAIVAMTGDGVNDAPALKKADIGVAMGQRGTEVAREAADMVLQDDAIGSIVVAVQQGRVILGNIRDFVVYLLSCNSSEVLVVGLASLADVPLPILPLQILFLNLVTDVFPALALGFGEGERGVMSRPPRDPAESLITGHHWRAIAGYGALLTAFVLGAFAVSFSLLGLSGNAAVTVSFLTLAFAQLWHVFDMRSPDSSIFGNDVVRNKYVWGAVLLCTGLLLLAVYAPPLAALLRTVPPSPRAWLVIAVASLMPTVLGQAATQLGWVRI